MRKSEPLNLGSLTAANEHMRNINTGFHEMEMHSMGMNGPNQILMFR